MQRQDKAYVQGRNEGGTIPRAPNHSGGAESLWGALKIPAMSQTLSVIQ